VTRYSDVIYEGEVDGIQKCENGFIAKV